MTLPQGSILNLPNLEELRCSVTSYSTHLGALHIAIYTPKFEKMLGKLVFTGVGYYSGLMDWFGAEFRYGDPTTHLEICRNLVGRDDSPDVTVQRTKFYTIQAKHKRDSKIIEVHIMAFDHGFLPEIG